MAQKPIREFHAKKIIQKNWLKYYENLSLKKQTALLTTEDYVFPEWALDKQLVAKPDMCFGKRAKNNLILINKNQQDTETWIKNIIKTPQKVYSSFQNGEPYGNYKEGYITHILVEEFIPHQQSQEFYLSIQTDKNFDIINFSTKGGIDIEENWDTEVTTIHIPIFTNREEIKTEIKKLTSNPLLESFILGTYNLFKDLHFSYLEFNPFLLIDNEIILLDTVAKLDDTAQQIMKDKWIENLHFPTPFGLPDKLEQVNSIEALDQKTGASLKLTILNPKGSIWTLLAGGGASIVAIDALTEGLPNHREVANYGEYSGNPTQEETFQYSNNFLQLLTKYPDIKNKKLIISGAIANFTDIAKTFQGIIKAIQLHKEALLEQKVEIYIRRGGPNYKEGLKNIKDACLNLGIPVVVHGPEVGLTEICKQAIS